MYLNLLLAVNESQDVIAWDGMAAVHELILVDVLVGDEDRFLAVELFRHGEVFPLFCLCLTVQSLFLAEEGYEFSPTFG